MRGVEPTMVLESEGVEVWALDLARARPAAPGELSPAEERRGSRRVSEADRRRFSASHAALRRLLAAKTGIDPAALRLEEGPHGRPFLPGGPSFSMTHAEDLWLCAVAPGRELGIDGERIRPVPEARDIAARWFTPRERERVAADEADGRGDAFLRGWVRKEAFLKALGVGFSVEGATAMDPDPQRWAVVDLDPAPGYVGALVVNRRHP
ncbi:MAG TPA: 4'-phosphopantetheinyl transferase superfamily protein [Anaeromyxobacteraceae bacterium]|nr:4'-phosphopantetheinyl transferase superfamily protein [Anaeromyxobacteraceae bacterium]